MLGDSSWLGLVLIMLLAWLAWTRCRQHPHGRTATVTARDQRLLKPRPPAKCPACCQQAPSPPTVPQRPPVTPWSTIKSRRGTPKRIVTQGFACPNRMCAYYQITDAQVHARVWRRRAAALRTDSDAARERRVGRRSARAAIPRSIASKPPLSGWAKCSPRWLSALDLRRGAGVWASAHDDHHLADAGRGHSATLHDRTFHNLHLPHIQLDELRTRLRSRAHPLWLSLAVAPLSKVIPVLHLDGRTQAAAQAVIHKLRQHLTPSCISGLSSDGLNLYFYALTAHFGHWVAATGRRARQWQVAAGLIYGQVKNTYRRHRLVRVTQVMRCSARAALKAALTELGLSGRLNTAFVERLKKDAAAERRGARAPHLVNTAGGATVAGPPGMVARRLPLRAAASVATSCTDTAECAGSAAAAAGLTRRRSAVQNLLTLPLPSSPRGTA